MENGRPFWACSPDELLRDLRAVPEGLSSGEAEQRQVVSASVRLKPQRDSQPLRLLLAQFRSPIILILLFVSCVSFFLAEHSDALIILAIILVSALLSFWQEYSAARAVAGLLALVQITAQTWRDGRFCPGPALRRTSVDRLAGLCDRRRALSEPGHRRQHVNLQRAERRSVQAVSCS